MYAQKKQQLITPIGITNNPQSQNQSDNEAQKNTVNINMNIMNIGL